MLFVLLQVAVISLFFVVFDLSYRCNDDSVGEIVFSFSFLSCVFSLISVPGFEVLFVFFRGTPIFVQTNFAPI